MTKRVFCFVKVIANTIAITKIDSNLVNSKSVYLANTTRKKNVAYLSVVILGVEF